MGWLRLGFAPRTVLPIGFGVGLIIVAWFRSRTVLWLVASAFALITIIKYFILFPATSHNGEHYVVTGVLLLGDLLVISAMAHLWIAAHDSLHRQNAELEAANTELVTREEEIARQNEELQSQTEELERQSEELRVTNEELAHRERTLQSLLSLSRTLATQMSRDETMTRICETLGELVNGPTAASAILEHQQDRLVVRCHHGFGPNGVNVESIPSTKSFAALVLSRGRTGYIEDISMRPDLVFLQPAEGPPMASVLAAPLRIGGTPVGTLEIYSRDKRGWSDEQISLVESLAAQTSVSLEAAQLFETISRERQRFEAVLWTVPIGIAVANGECSDVRVNPAGAAILNVPPDANIAAANVGTWQEFSDGHPLSPEHSPISRACRGIDTISQEIELVLPSNRRLVMLVNARPIRDKEGKIVGAVSAFADITPQKELQRELDLRRREAEEASVRKTRFLAAVSHDIRTPANAISLLAELIRRTAVNPSLLGDIPELARELHGSALSLINLLSDVLDVARFDSDKVELLESEFSLNELLDEEQRQMQPLARDRNLELIAVAWPEPIWLRTDRIKLARVLGNLIGNAIKFTERGEVRVEVSQFDAGGVQVRVIDTGVGIAPEHMRHIFDEFFQLRNPERDRSKGTGLGLTICKRLVDAMGAKIDVESAPGQGSTFTVSLPASNVLHGHR
jgi:signal transduction histidine kinase